VVIADNLPPVPIANPDPSSAILSGEAFGSEAGLGTGTTGAEAAGVEVVGTPSGAMRPAAISFHLISSTAP
jgi:hypothetical protein